MKVSHSIIRKPQPCTVCGEQLKVPSGAYWRHLGGFAHRSCALWDINDRHVARQEQLYC